MREHGGQLFAMLKIDAEILDEGEKVRLVFKDDNSPILRTDFSIDHLAQFIQELQHAANLAFSQRLDAGKGATKAPKPRTKPFEVHSAQIRRSRSGASLTLQVSAKDGRTAHLRLPIVLASALSDELRNALAAAGEMGGDAKH
jgi:hypothetical protein